MKSQTLRQEATSLPRTLKRKKPVYAESSSEDDTPLASSPMKSNGKPIVKQECSGTDAQDEEDASNKRHISNGKPPRKKIKDDYDDDDDDDDQPIMPAKSSTSRKRKARTKVEPDSEVEAPLQKAPRRKKVKEETNSAEREAPKKRKRTTKGKEAEGTPTKAKDKKKEEEEEEEEVFKWWENEADPNGDDGTVKWQTLEHNGVIFPPPYEPLPGDVKMKYKGMFLLWTLLSPLLFTICRKTGRPFV